MKGSEQKLEVNTQAHTVLKTDGTAETAVCVFTKVCLLFLPANSKSDFSVSLEAPWVMWLSFGEWQVGRSDVCHFQA